MVTPRRSATFDRSKGRERAYSQPGGLLLRRFIQLICIAAPLAGVYAGTASAGGYDDSACNPQVGKYGYEECYLPSGRVGTPYSWKLTTHGGCPPFVFKVADGTIPPGLQVSSGGSYAVISGTPQVQGTYRFNIQYTSNTPTCLGDENDRYFNITILGAKLTVQTSALKPPITGTPYSQQLTTNSSAPVTWSVSAGTLPAGLSLSSNGVISGTPLVTGASTFTVTASGDGQTDTKQLTIQVVAPLKLTAKTPKGAEVGIQFDGTITASGGLGPYTWTTGTLPPGLTFDSARGVITGVPTLAGLFPVKFSVSDPGTSTATEVDLTLRVAAPLTISSKSLRMASVAHAYAVKLHASGGVRAFKWTIRGKLPKGLKLDAKAGAIIGTPRSAGKARLTLSVRDALGAVSRKRLVLTVRG